MPALTGRDGGHDTNLRQYAADGMALAGRLTGADGERLTFAGDLTRNLERGRPLLRRALPGRSSTPTSSGPRIEAPPADDVAVDLSARRS